VFDAGVRNTMLHYDGTEWVPMHMGPARVNDGVGLWGTSSSDVFAVSSKGSILHYDGSTWSAQSYGKHNDLYGVWGSSGHNVFAVGKRGTILHYGQSLPKGACCLPGGGCAMCTRSACVAQGGTYRGDGSLCSANPCCAPDIKVNSQDDVAVLPHGRSLNVTVAMNPGEHAGEDADWWFILLLVHAPTGQILPVAVINLFQVPLFDLPPATILHTAAFPQGLFVFLFAVDLDMDGQFDSNRALMDSAAAWVY